MKKITLVILSVLIGFSAIAKTHKAKKKKAAKGNDIVSVLMMRTGCFGHCPTYSIEIKNNGMVTYNAIRFNTDSGTYQKKMGIAKTDVILNDIVKLRLDTCQDQYDNLVPDLPNTNYEIVYKNKTKKIYAARFGPDILKEMTHRIDEMGHKPDGDNTWKKVAETK
ncbi:MAG: hypothetical protein JWQ38_367 [Flavipsychrobacter sp.]|nr:hypothetical protein [Flavipsychrobacter sp.]